MLAEHFPDSAARLAAVPHWVVSLVGVSIAGLLVGWTLLPPLTPRDITAAPAVEGER